MGIRGGHGCRCGGHWALFRRTGGQGQFRWHGRVELTSLWAKDRCLEKAGLGAGEDGRPVRGADLTSLQSLGGCT